MKTPMLLVVVLAGAAGWLAASWWPSGPGLRLATATAAESLPASYQCPMHPWVQAAHASQCTLCGMNLVAARRPATPASTGQPGRELVVLEAGTAPVAGVRTMAVAVRSLSRTLRVSGRLVEDESQHGIICAPVAGRIDGLAMNCAGQGLHTLEPFATIFSRTLLQAAAAYQKALPTGGPALTAATEALLQDGLSPLQITAIPHRQPEDIHFGLLAQLSGTIVKSYVHEGQYVSQGQKLFELADFSRLWFEFPAYEQDLPWLHRGQMVTLTAATLPGVSYRAKIDFIEPSLDETTHTAMVRVVVENRDGRFRNNTLAEGLVELDAPEVLTVPRSAVLWPGHSPRVYVEQNPGAYQPRELTLGRAGDSDWEVVAGLGAGERVVVAGNFLLDSQAQLDREAMGTVSENAP